MGKDIWEKCEIKYQPYVNTYAYMYGVGPKTFIKNDYTKPCREEMFERVKTVPCPGRGP